jgi:3-isopropylmalate/(R)-2-methylmalate dehydratase small subunit
MDAAAGGSNHTFTVDLEAQTIDYPGGSIRFEIDPERKRRLLNGLDNIGLTLGKAAAIDSFEIKQRAAQPWLYG